MSEPHGPGKHAHSMSKTGRPAQPGEGRLVPIERPLLEILACPIDKLGLLYFEDEAILYNPRLRRIYRLADDYLIMLADRAEPATVGEHERLLKRARHGDAVGTGGMAAEALALLGPAGQGTRESEGGWRHEATENGRAGPR